MRMRRKKNLEQRYDACADLLIEVNVNSLNLSELEECSEKFDALDEFGNDNPLYLEIGCGKGQFAIEMAKRHPDINFIAVEKTQNVIVTAVENAIEAGVSNLRFIKCPAEYLSSFFAENSVDRLYLNFSCPYPKKKYAKHRLTHECFLSVYQKFLCPSAEIHIKTDNAGLFEFSINSLSGFGYTLKNVTFDLHNSDFEGNIVTEYEHRFSEMGCNIYRLEAYYK